MSKARQLLGCFQRMPPEHLRRLTAAQKDELLAVLHAHLSEDLLERPKHKLISKQRAVSYKRYIRAHMPAIIRRMVARVARHPHPEPPTGSHEHQSKFKSGSMEARRRKMESFDSHFREVACGGGREQLNCSICLETLVRPVLTICGHAFCFQCLDESLLFSSSCPNCRENIKGVELISCGVLDRLIKQASASTSLRLGWGALYGDRLRRFEDWRRRREVEGKSLKVGMVLDVRDTENIWCQGTVMEVEWEAGREGPSSVLVHFNRWDNIYNQIIELPSLRLAPLHFFSTRTDIPRYNLSLQDHNMRGLVVSGNTNPNPNPQPQTIEVDSSSEEELSNHNLLLPQPFPAGRNAITEFLTHWNFPPMFRLPQDHQEAQVNEQDIFAQEESENLLMEGDEDAEEAEEDQDGSVQEVEDENA